MAWPTLNFNWQWQLKSSSQQLWPFVADTQRFNQAAHLPTIHFTSIGLETGGSRLMGKTSRFGVPVEYEDHHFHWVREQQFTNRRTFTRGPVVQTDMTLRLHPNQEGTLLTYDVALIPANIIGYFGAFYQFGWLMRRNFGRVFRQIDAYAQGIQASPFVLPPVKLTGSGRARLNRLSQDLITAGHDPQHVDHLKTLLLNEIDANLSRIRPYKLADTWGIPRATTLEMFLSAAKLGLLNLRWEVLCPLCRGGQGVAPALDELRKGTHCPISANFNN